MDDAAPLNGGVSPEAGLPEAEQPAAAVSRLLDEAAGVSRELGQLAEDMAAQSEAGRREAQRLIARLTEATAALGGAGGEEAPTAKSGLAAAPRGSDGARMLARQMLANGSDRGAVERSLRTSFHVEDAATVVDSLLSPADG